MCLAQIAHMIHMCIVCKFVEIGKFMIATHCCIGTCIHICSAKTCHLREHSFVKDDRVPIRGKCTLVYLNIVDCRSEEMIFYEMYSTK